MADVTPFIGLATDTERYPSTFHAVVVPAPSGGMERGAAGGAHVEHLGGPT